MRIALVKGTGLICRFIRWQTRSEFSHAAILDSNGVVYEAATTGVRSWRAISTDDEGIYAALKRKFGAELEILNVETTPDQERAVLQFLWRQLSKRYDFTMVFRFLTREQEARSSTNKWFCSELVFAAFQKAGINLLERIEPWEVSPGLLAYSPLAVSDQEAATIEESRV